MRIVEIIPDPQRISIAENTVVNRPQQLALSRNLPWIAHASHMLNGVESCEAVMAYMSGTEHFPTAYPATISAPLRVMRLSTRPTPINDRADSMNNVFFIVTAYSISLFIISISFKHLNILTEQTLLRSSPIDALRGLLATSVVCHHFVVTYHWKTSGVWERPQSDVLNNMGVVPVSLFFMITGFLFFGKIYKKNPEWSLILRSRIQRVMPLYIVVVFMVFVISLMKTGFIFDADIKGLLKSLVSWGLFVGSSFNGSPDSIHMTSGAHWTLRYEWLFYFSLPAVAAIFNMRWYGKYLVLSALVMILAIPGIYLGLVAPKLALLFFIGFIPAVININSPQFSSLAKSRTASLVVLTCIGSGMFIGQGYSMFQMLVLGVPFTMIALGNTIFGVLGSKGLKALGEVSYSIYLIHGLILYTLFSVFEVFSFRDHTALQYIAWLPLVLALVCAISILTFSAIEKPFIFVRDKNVTALP